MEALGVGHASRVLSEWASLGDWRLLFLHRDRLKSVTVADVQRVATTFVYIMLRPGEAWRSEQVAGADVRDEVHA